MSSHRPENSPAISVQSPSKTPPPETQKPPISSPSPIVNDSSPPESDSPPPSPPPESASPPSNESTAPPETASEPPKQTAPPQSPPESTLAPPLPVTSPPLPSPENGSPPPPEITAPPQSPPESASTPPLPVNSPPPPSWETGSQPPVQTTAPSQSPPESASTPPLHIISPPPSPESGFPPPQETAAPPLPINGPPPSPPDNVFSPPAPALIPPENASTPPYKPPATTHRPKPWRRPVHHSRRHPDSPIQPSPPQASPAATLPPASSAQPTKPHIGGSTPPLLSPPIAPPAEQGVFMPPEALAPVNGSTAMPISIGGPSGSVGKPRSSRGLVIVGVVFGGFLLLAVIGLLVYIICRGRRRGSRKDGDKGSCGTSLAGPEVLSNSKQDIAAPALHVVPVLTTALPSPAFRSRAGGFSFTNPVHSQDLGVKLGVSSALFTYDELLEVTNNFSQANLIGHGGFGDVYKGILSNGKEVAVKQLKKESQQGDREFQAEVETISRLHHKHLVSLLGYCISGAERLLVYEFVPNNTLEFHLHRNEQPVMEWETRLKIAIGSAKGLSYLHEDCHPAIIHRDIKASNILLDYKFEVSDFGLAKSFPDTSTPVTHITTRVVGTFGYLAPEYASSGHVTERSDVYSYGVMLLELLTGRPPISTTASLVNENLVNWAWPLLVRSLETGIYDTFMDPRLQGKYNRREMARMVACATACVQHSARLRPRMRQIIRALEGDNSLTDIIEGIKARQEAYGSSERSSYGAHQYEVDMKMFNRLLASREYDITGSSQATSEYGLNPSTSSSESYNHKA